MPASNDTRVRVEDFSKIIARDFPDSAVRQEAGAAFIFPRELEEPFDRLRRPVVLVDVVALVSHVLFSRISVPVFPSSASGSVSARAMSTSRPPASI